MSAEDRWATFDCYGTLIDWDRGIGDVLAGVWPGEDRDELVRLYHRIEPAVQAGTAIPYREVMVRSFRWMARERGLPLAAGDEGALGESLPSWPPFPDVPGALEELRRRGWRLAILSNTDPELLAASIERIGVPVDLTVTVTHAGSYKPAHGHWRAFQEIARPDPLRHVHVAASPFHDLAPCSELGIPAVWINRAGETTGPPPGRRAPLAGGPAGGCGGRPGGGLRVTIAPADRRGKT